MAKSAVDKMLDEIRAVLAKYAELGVPKQTMYEELLSEADGWKMRLCERG